MTVTDPGPVNDTANSIAFGAPPPPPTGIKAGRGRRRWVLIPAIGLVVGLVVAGGTGFLIYGRTYQPLSWGNATRLVSASSIKTIGDGLSDTNLILVGPKGTTGTVVYQLDNNGPHPIRVLADTNDSDNSLGWNHSTWLPFRARSIFLPIVTCPPKSASSHVDPDA